MTKPCIITVAITGSVPRKEDTPAVPVTVSEQIESTHEAFEAGATIVHVHVRDEQQRPSSDPDKFAAFQEGVRKHCPGMIVQFSTGGRGRAAEERGSMLHHRPDMASLATGSVNFPNMIYENHPELVDELAARMLEYDIKPEIEIFDLAMLYTAARMVGDGQLKAPLHVQFVFGLKNALPPRREILEFEVAQLKALLPDATWTAAGIGRSQLEMNHWALELGGHCRTGLEDNIRYDKSRLAASNAELVARVAGLCADYNRHPASVEEARRILSLAPATAVA
jgi:3-keto-5-aminohexanoate cleavage enzyme